MNHDQVMEIAHEHDMTGPLTSYYDEADGNFIHAVAGRAQSRGEARRMIRLLHDYHEALYRHFEKSGDVVR